MGEYAPDKGDTVDRNHHSIPNKENVSRIYKITNLINQKSYIGKTEFSIEKRFRQHTLEINKERSKNRPLYRAMCKYGIENFKIELIEICTEAEVNDREQYYIRVYNTYKFGYNATLGGDGKAYVDSEKIIAAYLLLKNIAQTAKETGYDKQTVSKTISNHGVVRQSHREVVTASRGRAVLLVELGLKFDSMQIASEYIRTNYHKFKDSRLTNMTSKISLVCRGLRKSAYGYTWEYI